ncbi:hypothetical protein OG592_42105 (plasmid) [Streptomyces avidinii]|uniref:hypothetical protein n=1 Tax=Streptomyces avidinii TaxID=1895 RepID=UPI00386FABBB|nr:hypothetical protein OG592_42105 [Streptomyces avidinii]
MELIIFIICIGVIAWVIDDSKKKSQAKKQAAAEAERFAQISDPAWMGAEIVSAVQVGDAQRLAMTAAALPAWPIRVPLQQAAQHLSALHLGAGVAEAVAVPRVITDEVRAGVGSALTDLRAVVVKVVSLARFFGDDWRQFPEEPRRLLEQDAVRLHRISEAARALHYDLGVAMAAGSTAGEADAAGRNLRALAEAIRELSQGLEKE